MNRMGRRLLAWSMMAASCLPVLAQEGVVRITDAKPSGPFRTANLASNGSPGQPVGGAAGYHAIPAGFGGHGHGRGYWSSVGSDCYGGDCYGGDVYGGSGYGGCPSCGPHGCRSGCLWRVSGHFHERYGSHSPDHGWSIPAKYPLVRRGVEYTQYMPTHWTGMPGAGAGGPAAPQVYMPSDTSQMGFYYQHVPFWSPTNPNPLPQRPDPAMWHQMAPCVDATSGCGWGTGWRVGGRCRLGACRNGGWGDYYDCHGDCYGHGFGDCRSGRGCGRLGGRWGRHGCEVGCIGGANCLVTCGSTCGGQACCTTTAPAPYAAQPAPYDAQPAPYQAQPAPYQAQPAPGGPAHAAPTQVLPAPYVTQPPAAGTSQAIPLQPVPATPPAAGTPAPAPPAQGAPAADAPKGPSASRSTGLKIQQTKFQR